MSFICIDLESAPLPESELTAMMPTFEAAGNLKDPEKVKASIEAKRSKWLEDAALSAETGRVLCVGALRQDIDPPAYIEGDEKTILLETASLLARYWSNLVIVGHNLYSFDAVFLIRRMWKHNIKPPDCLYEMCGKRFNDRAEGQQFSFDTMLGWSFGKPDERISLANLARHLGVGVKDGSGKDFAKLYETDREAALKYLDNDLRLTAACYERIRR